LAGDIEDLTNRYNRSAGKKELVMDHWDIEPRDTLCVFIAEMEVASTSMRQAQKALEASLLEVCCGYQDISAQISYALTQSEAALEEARQKLEELEPQIR
jgi:hypothetical protein